LVELANLKSDTQVTLQRRADALRGHVLAVAEQKATHVGGAMSCAEIMAALFFSYLRLDGSAKARDHFILSKGHVVPILHACLVELGLLEASALIGSGQTGSALGGHPARSVPGVEYSTGSLGHGLSVGFGMALGESLSDSSSRTVVLLGDGELQEGTVWEAASAAARFPLPHLTAIVDVNGFRATGDFAQPGEAGEIAAKWAAFGWDTEIIDGHDLTAILKALNATSGASPRAIVAKTVKGRGVPSVEGSADSHFLQLTDSQTQDARANLGVGL
jgi:transketolase